MSNIEINRKNIADMLLGLYEKEPFSMNTNVEELECNVWGGYYDMDMTTAQISFNDNNSLTAYGNFITEFISGLDRTSLQKRLYIRRTFSGRFRCLENRDFRKSRTTRYHGADSKYKECGDYLKSPQIFTFFQMPFFFPPV